MSEPTGWQKNLDEINQPGRGCEVRRQGDDFEFWRRKREAKKKAGLSVGGLEGKKNSHDEKVEDEISDSFGSYHGVGEFEAFGKVDENN